jgi:hypothetical protein
LPKLGWYLKEKYYNNKWTCMADNKMKNKGISFYFFEDVFSNYNWEKEPEGSYELLLETRAKQIRDSYSYVRLWYSSGSDSETMLQTFLKHNIHIDEIMVSTSPFKESDAELIKRAIPKLKLLENQLYKTKITILKVTGNQFLDIVENQDYDKIATDFTLRSTGYLSACYYTNPELCEKPHLTNNKVVNLIGHTKPRLEKRDNKFFAYEYDTAISQVSMTPNLEFFYTTPDFPELHIKQLHIVKNYIKFKYPDLGDTQISENSDYRNDIEEASRVSIDNTFTFSKKGTLRGLQPKAKLAVQEAFTLYPSVYYALKTLTNDHRYILKNWKFMGVKSKEYYLGT